MNLDSVRELKSILSQSVLANENRAKLGDAILQPGAFDGGQNPADAVGKLAKFEKLQKAGANKVDCALASLNADIKTNTTNVKGLGTLAGIGDAFLDEGTRVAKLGRTTGLTRGRVTAFELDNVVVEFDIGYLRFDDQVEIEGAEAGPFSQGGDSGSLIVGEDLHAVALLFAGGDQGGSNGQGLTYANPIRTVLEALGVDLVVVHPEVVGDGPRPSWPLSARPLPRESAGVQSGRDARAPASPMASGCADLVV